MRRRILITGAAGSVGTALTERLRALGEHPVTTDVAWYDACLDVTDAESVARWVRTTRPDVIFHLAGAKHAPEGELDPGHVARVNIDGTRNVVAAAWPGTRIVLSSTCKAADPETAYGASKLIAERMVLNAGGVVVRFYNVPETAGNVFRLWESLPADAPIPWTNCWRFFVPLDRAVDLCVRALTLPPGRWAPDPGEARHMGDLARELYPDRERVQVRRRRGDRQAEPLYAASETWERQGDLLRIRSPHDGELARRETPELVAA